MCHGDYVVMSSLLKWVFSEIRSLLEMVCQIDLPDGRSYKISFNDTTTVSEAVQEVARSIKLSTTSGFGLFRFNNVRVSGNGEYIPLHENNKLTNVVAELNAKDKLLFKIKVFRDEAITDPVFLHMSFFQLRHDYLCGNYSALSQEDVEQLSALLILADIGFNAKPRSVKTWYKILNKSKPQFINRKYCKQGLKGNIENIYLSLKTWNKEDAVHEFMSILSKLPYGKSIFYNAKKITGDPKHRHVIVGVNKVGVHIFGLDQHRLLLHSIEMKDIRRFGSSKTRFLLKRRDDKLEFETELAEEMCLTLKTHIRDSMERRGATADSDVSQPHNASVSNINLDSRDEAFKQREDAVKEVAILRGKLQQVREDHARFKENFLCTVAEVDKLSIKAGSLEETCSSQRDEISVLQHQLAAANQKLKMADLSSSEIRTEYEDQKRIVADLQDRLREAENQLLEGEKLRKKLHNTILELKGNIRVFCRVRPLLPDDGPGAEPTVSYPTSAELAGRGIDLIQSGQKYPFTFDKVFAHDASQQEVFMEISQLVQSALDGYEVCIFAYGQTGSGKTYTMMGRPEAPLQKGLIPRSLEQVFQTSQALAAQGWKYKMQASMLEIYNENIQDLLASKSNAGKGGGKQQHQYKISHDAEGNTTVADLTIVDVSTIGEVSNLLQKAAHCRSVGRTDMNEESSWSHFVFTLRIYGLNESTEQQVQGVLNLIDLAGSQRLSKSGATGERLKETRAINKSLSSLSDVIFALVKKDHVPFRNSKLTFLLQPCLGGDSKTLMFVNMSPDPSSIGESLCSLRFAARVNSCEIGIPRRQAVQPLDSRLSCG